MSTSEINFVKKIFKQGLVRVVVVIYSQSWEVADLEAHLVLIVDAERYDGLERRFVEYSIPDMLQMMGRANKT
jgi:pre-mRNA-splicing helicase BRR2